MSNFSTLHKFAMDKSDQIKKFPSKFQLKLSIENSKMHSQTHQSINNAVRISIVNINICLKFRHCSRWTNKCFHHFIHKSANKKQSEWFYYEYVVFVHYNAHDFHIHEDTYVVNFRMNNFLLIFFLLASCVWLI